MANQVVHPASAMDFMPVEKLRALQLERLQKTVKHTYDNVALFRQRMDERGVKPEDVRELKDLADRKSVV